MGPVSRLSQLGRLGTHTTRSLHVHGRPTLTGPTATKAKVTSEMAEMKALSIAGRAGAVGRHRTGDVTVGTGERGG